MKKAIQKLKNNKAAGDDGIPPELLKADTDLMASLLQPIIKDTWENEELPDGWDTGLIVKLPKKGDLKICENWRGITLLNCAAKILAQIVYTRLAAVIEPSLRQEQAGFRLIDRVSSMPTHCESL